MRRLDVASLLLAGLMGALMLIVLIDLFDDGTSSAKAQFPTYAFFGMLTGLGVQVAERMTGVS